MQQNSRFQKKASPQNGFIALFSAVIISAILMAIAFGAHASELVATMDLSDYETTYQVTADVQSCAQETLLSLALHQKILPGTFPLGNIACTIDAIATTTDTVTFTVHSSYQHSFATQKITAKTIPHITITDQHEILP